MLTPHCMPEDNRLTLAAQSYSPGETVTDSGLLLVVPEFGTADPENEDSASSGAEDIPLDDCDESDDETFLALHEMYYRRGNGPPALA